MCIETRPLPWVSILTTFYVLLMSVSMGYTNHSLLLLLSWLRQNTNPGPYHPHLAGKRFTVAVLGHLVFGIKRLRAHLMLFGWLPPLLLLLPLETCCEHPLVTRAGRNRFIPSSFFSRSTECEDPSYKTRWTRSWCWQEGLLLISVHSVRGSDEPINTNVR